MTPLKNEWMKIYSPLVDHLKLQVRMNVKSKSVEIRVGANQVDGQHFFTKGFLVSFLVEGPWANALFLGELPSALSQF